MKWSAPAKINLSLRVLGRRADGFHEIETLIVPLSLADELEIDWQPEGSASTGIELECSDPTLPTGPENLAYRAAELFRREVAPDLPPVRILLTKQVPHGAGLGGGSSDAATVLMVLDRLAGTHLPPARLNTLAAELGSDVPFFLAGGPAFCRGRGELVEPAVFRARLPLLLLKPPFRSRRLGLTNSGATRGNCLGSVTHPKNSIGANWSTTSNVRCSKNISSWPN